MSENFTPEEKQLIEKFINSLKEDLNNPEILIEYDVTEHGKYIGSEYEIPRGNAYQKVGLIECYLIHLKFLM